MAQQAVKIGAIERVRYLAHRAMMIVAWSPERGRRYARRLGVEVGDGAMIFNAVSFGSEPWLVRVGRDSWMTYGVQCITHDGAITVLKNGPFGLADPGAVNRYGGIVIEDNCFIGVRSILMPGITIHANSIVAAGSVVTKSVPTGTVAGGNPAREICSVRDYCAKVVAESLPIPAEWPDMETKRNRIRSLIFGSGEG